MGSARSTLDALLERLSASLGPAAVVLAGSDVPAAPAIPEDSDRARLTPTALRRIGRSRRGGALLDLELSVRVDVTGPGALDLLEQLLVLAETGGMTVDTDPEPSGLGLTLVLPVTVPLDEPTGPPVITTVVEVHALPRMPAAVDATAGTTRQDTKLPSPSEGS